MLDAATVIAFSHRAAELAALEGARLSAAGLKLETPDLLIAGTALELGLPLVTRNVPYFARINGLTLLDPN